MQIENFKMKWIYRGHSHFALYGFDESQNACHSRANGNPGNSKEAQQTEMKEYFYVIRPAWMPAPRFLEDKLRGHDELRPSLFTKGGIFWVRPNLL